MTHLATAQSTLWSTPAKKPAAASSAKATKTPAKAAASAAAVKPPLQKKPSLQIFTEDKARSLQEKLHSFMMLSPIHAAAAAADHAESGVLVFRDLSHCVSPMTTRDAVDRDDHDAADDEDDVVVAVEDVDAAWPLWNLSAATVDQHAASDDVSPRVSLETAAVHPAGVPTAPAAIAPFSPAAVKVAPPVVTPSTTKAAALLALKLPQDVDLADGDVSDDETVVVQQLQPTAAALDTSLLIA